MRELKFRVWLTKKQYDYYKLEDFCGIDDRYFLEDTIVEQYTGLKDKNGKEIYEGDILKRVEEGGFDIVGVVEWSKMASRFWVDRYYYPNGGKWEVIGNIHENPELLGGKE